MKHNFTNPENGGLFTITDFENSTDPNQFIDKKMYKVFFNTIEETKLIVDGNLKIIQKNQLFFCKPLNVIKLDDRPKGLKAITFNKAFYAIKDYDNDVPFYWFWLFGTKYPMLLSLPDNDMNMFKSMFNCFEREFDNKISRIQEEMLRYILKRILVMSNSYIEAEEQIWKLDNKQLETIRKFNQLIEKNYKEKHQVSEYAAMLYKSPKTISNLFRIHCDVKPSVVIRNRIILEAKRLLLRTNLTIEEITYELGYDTTGHFSNLFKNVVGVCPTLFRKSETQVVIN